MPRFVRMYIYDGHNSDALDTLMALAQPPKSIGSQEPVHQRLLEDPRWRRLVTMTLPDSLEATFAMAAIRGADRFEILEERDA